MATLVLSTVGTMLGGPIGGAIGSLIGHGIDQQLFGPGPRSGPRLGDLNVQTSSYGTPVPRLYGMIRVAGTVVWATDLQESSETQSGAKGQPDVTIYSYSVSMAVALSSRPVRRIKRIWADGKLLRGRNGDFKVKTKFRFHDGTEDQEIDPMIASIEGIGKTPAYRGLALAVFEDLQLAEYGNRIPFLTFEVEADEDPPTLSSVLADASGKSIRCDAADAIGGYAAYGRSIRAAVQPLVDHFGVELFDDGQLVRSPQPILVTPDEWELGCSADAEVRPKRELTQTPARSLPATMAITYYDQARDYQAGQMQASIGAAGAHEQAEVPIASDAASAKALVEASLARRWAQRDLLTVRLAPPRLAMEPGARVQMPGSNQAWAADRVAIEGMAIVAELRPVWEGVAGLPAEPGRPVPAPDFVKAPTQLALLDLPDLGLTPTATAALHLAAASSSAGWRAVPIEIVVAGEIRSGQSAFQEAVLGHAIAVPGAGHAALLDLANSIEVELADEGHWLESRDDEALVQGANLAALGSELIQFGSAIPIGPKRFRLERLLRGRRGTEWAIAGHVPGEPFVLLSASSLRAIELPRELIGSPVEVRALGVGDGAGTAISAILSGEAMRPPGPVHVQARARSDASLDVSWVRRSRSGWAWLDEMDAPLGETAELYRIRIDGAAGSLEIETAAPQITIGATELAALGSGPASLSVTQVGDHAVSRPAVAALNLP